MRAIRIYSERNRLNTLAGPEDVYIGLVALSLVAVAWVFGAALGKGAWGLCYPTRGAEEAKWRVKACIAAFFLRRDQYMLSECRGQNEQRDQIQRHDRLSHIFSCYLNMAS